jgi:hypothetical protein
MAPQNHSVTLAGSALERRCRALRLLPRPRGGIPAAALRQEGFAQDDKIFQIVDARHREERPRRIAGLGLDAEASGQLEIRPWENTHLREGRFDQYAMLALVEEGAWPRKGEVRLHALLGEHGMVARRVPGVDDIVQYESRLNEVTSRFDDVVVCTYDLNRFSATVVMDILRTHPQVIVGGILQENPFYVPPQQFLGELRARAVPVE